MFFFSWQIITLQFTGKLLDTYKFAALQKMDDPSEICLSEEISIPSIPHKKYVRKILNFLQWDRQSRREAMVSQIHFQENSF